MKTRKKIILYFILILIVLSLGFVSSAFVYSNVIEDVEVKELSLLQQKFVVKSQYTQIVMNEEKEVKNEKNEKNESEKEEELLQLNPDGTVSGSGRRNTYSSGSGSNNSGNGGGGNIVYTQKISIPRTGIYYTIYDDMTTRNMERGVAILATDWGLNNPGNTVISGHNRNNRRFFSRNDRIQIGDLIYIRDSSGGTVTYSVYNIYITDPSDASYIDRETNGDREISLTTCTSDGENRLIIWASEI